MFQQIRGWVLKYLNIADIRPDAWDNVLIRETAMEYDVNSIKRASKELEIKIGDVSSSISSLQLELAKVWLEINKLKEVPMDIEVLAPVISADKAVEEAKPEIKPIKAVKKRIVKKTTKG